MEMFPDAANFQHELFKSDDFFIWAERLGLQKLVHAETHVPAHELVRLAMHSLSDVMNTNFSILMAEIRSVKASVESLLEDTRRKDEKLQLLEAQISQGFETIRNTVRQSRPISRMETREEDSADVDTVMSGGPLDQAMPISTEISSRNATPIMLEQPKDRNSRFVCSRSVMTVFDVLTEWRVGWQGGPPIQDLAALPRGHWGLEPKENRYYNRRRLIVDWLNEQTSYETVDDAARALHNFQHAQKITTLHALQERIRGAKNSKSKLF